VAGETRARGRRGDTMNTTAIFARRWGLILRNAVLVAA
jgi:hypothetical protein